MSKDITTSYSDYYDNDIKSFFYNNTNININGNEVRIDKYKKVYKVTDSEVIVMFNKKNDEIMIKGKNLKIKIINDEYMIIRGIIISVSYPKKDKAQEKG